MIFRKSPGVSLALAEASALPGDGVNAWRSLTLPVLGVEAGIPPAVSQRPLRLSPRRWEWISGIHLPGRYLRFAYTIPAVLGAYRARSPASLRFAYACALPGDGVRTGYAVPCRWLWLEACALPAMGVVFGKPPASLVSSGVGVGFQIQPAELQPSYFPRTVLRSELLEATTLLRLERKIKGE